MLWPLADELDQLRRVRKAIVLERDHRALGPDLQPLHAGRTAQLLERHDLQQVLRLHRQRPEAVDQLRREGVDLLLVGEVRQPAIEAEAHVEVLHVALGDQHRHADVDGRRPVLRRHLLRAARLAHRLFEQVLVEFHTHLAHMAGLLVAQQVARAADVEVMAGEGEARAQLVEGLHHLEPALRRLGQRLAGRRREICVAAQLGPADATAQLVELRQAEHVGAVDDHGVGVAEYRGRLSTILVDSSTLVTCHRTKSCIVFSICGRRQPAVRHGTNCASLGPGSRNSRGNCVSRSSMRGTDVKALAAAVLLAQQRLAHDGNADRRAVTKVRTARRSTGGVAIRLMSRTPVTAQAASVRGIGVAVSVSTWTSASQLLQPLLVAQRRNVAPRPRSRGRGPWRSRCSWPAARGCR